LVAGLQDRLSTVRGRRRHGEIVVDTTAYDRRAHRTAARQEVHGLLRQVFQARDFPWWQQRLSAFNAPWAPVFTRPGELLDDPQAVARDLFTTPARPGAGPQARFPVTFEAGLDTFRSPAPELGQHNKEVLDELDAVEAAR
jgi:crotonobetainyl-CoA:carnitine CoA-transferase CaiB-like acyl-CoA transferase